MDKMRYEVLKCSAEVKNKGEERERKYAEGAQSNMPWRTDRMRNEVEMRC